MKKNRRRGGKKKRRAAGGELSQDELADLRMARWLTDRNFDSHDQPRTRDPCDYPIHVAVVEENMDAISWLVTRKGSSVLVKNENGDGPLQNAAFRAVDPAIIQIILKAEETEKASAGSSGLY